MLYFTHKKTREYVGHSRLGTLALKIYHFHTLPIPNGHALIQIKRLLSEDEVPSVKFHMTVVDRE